MNGRIRRWIEPYERAWRSPGTELLAELFTPDARYVPDPFAEPIRGLPAIAEFWEAERDGPDETFSMTVEIIAEQDDRGVARVEVVYGDPPTRHYRDLWLTTFDPGGRVRDFEEWPFFPGRPRVAPPPDGAGR